MAVRRRYAVGVVVLVAATWWAFTALPSDAAAGGISAVWNVPDSPYAPGDDVVALTFDDGPNPTYTRRVLDILERYHAPATFFVIGREAAAHPDLVQAESAAGHAVANHTWDHVDLTRTPAGAYAHQVDDTSDVIQANTGRRPTCLRPPGGRLNNSVTARVADRGLATVGWSVDPSDYTRPGAEAIAARVLANVRPGSIILLHDGGGDRSQTVAALPAIIDGIRSRGLRPVSVCGAATSSVAPVPPPPPALTTAQWLLHTTPTSGRADIEFSYGDRGDLPLVGDWDGDGLATPGVQRGNLFLLRNSNSVGVADVVFSFGDPGDRVIVGDWNGDGTDTLGVVRGSAFLLRNANSTGPADAAFAYGDPGDHPIVGKWQPGAAADTVGVVRGSAFLLRNSNSAGAADLAFSYGYPGEHIEIGDWDGDGVDTPAVLRGSTYLVRNSNTAGPAQLAFDYGLAQEHFPLVGRWSVAAGLEGPGVAR